MRFLSIVKSAENRGPPPWGARSRADLHRTAPAALARVGRRVRDSRTGIPRPV